MTHKSTWKQAESSVAELFGARRRILSGSSNRSDIDGDDSMHARLYIETKLREKHATWTLFREVKAKAAKCKRVFQGGSKTPILGLREKFKKGVLIVVHSNDFMEVAAEYVAACGEDEILRFQAMVRARRSGALDEEGNQDGHARIVTQ